MKAVQINEADKQLHDTVVEHLRWTPEITSRDITVGARDGVVTLAGFVHSYPEKYAAEREAKRVYGVRALANDIIVKPLLERSDPEIAHAIVQAFESHVSIPDEKIKVSVRDGHVTLEGSVEWHHQREKAASTARTIHGVRGVNNHIMIKPHASSTDVKTRIEAALRRIAEVDARRITVKADGGSVHLYGNVRSWAEREEAARAAWSAAGVLSVINEIAVLP